MNFASRLKKLRSDKGWTQKELGDRLSISDRVIGYYESGDRFPKDENTLKMMSNLFNVTIDYLVGSTDNKMPPNHSDVDYVPTEFTDPIEARKYVMMHAIFGSDGLNVAKMDDEEIIKFANDLMKQMEMVSYKYRK